MMTDFLASAKRVVDIEAQALNDLTHSINADFNAACELLMGCQGKVVVSGMGKSGHIGHKIAATFASTGTPAFFMHPGEANHGDLGMLGKSDVLLAISNSGESAELINLLPVVKRLKIPIIAMTNSTTSTLGKNADVVLNIAVNQEACSLGLAPTTSTTVTLVMGDALAVALLDARGFTSDDFALSHPGGSLGRKLLLSVDDIMLRGEQIPLVKGDSTIIQALLEISAKGLGMTGVVGERDQLVGIFTDGDLRRILDDRIDLHSTPVSQVMTPNSICVAPRTLAVSALNTMEKHKISALFVVDEQRIPVGAFNMHLLLQAGVV
ncbi:KpsF/GutQ family sugar-phosphate isomerase [Alteromonas oceanisediminis]|uniref:KpsF/GutQ family sugar-phosphate isomerase n=1 Tax=Alteromonas oceanisediminis TaxID=2836180 RepID=UPI001BDA0CA5|nr:KpsF/GutQ family sugar-phosphate isomerase [Alteromonas oceanisediminis]MBT0585439.1 KpsF/GutQ family sugar-phosphate isomerase [Alteromonas oceanisediminis]